MAFRPFTPSNRREDNRIIRTKQVACFTKRRSSLLAAFITALIVMGTRHACAGAPPTGTITLVTADGKPRGLQLRAQTVDVTIMEDAEGVWADTRIWVLLRNPGKAPVVLPAALGGPQLGATKLPEILEAAADGKRLALRPLMSRDGTAPIAFTAPITIPMQSGVAVRVRYRQALPAQDGLITFAYPITATLRWPGTPESLRVTLKFDPPGMPEQLLSLVPPPQQRGPDRISWTWDAQKPQTNIGLAFMAPSWWDAFTAAQTAASAPAAGLAEHLTLSQRYRHLAMLPPPSFDPAVDYYGRYHSAELAEVRAALSFAASAPAADCAAAYVLLAQAYLEDARRADPSRSEPYLREAAAALETAVSLTPTDAELRVQAADLHRRLADAAGARGDAASSAQHLTRAAALAAGRPASEEALAQSAALTQATDAAAAGDLSRARQLVAAAFGPDAVTLPGAPPPRITQSLVAIETSITTRSVALRLADATGSDAGGDLLARAAEALVGALVAVPGAQLTSSADELRITLPFTDTATLAAAQTRLADALPPEPELALLAAALRPAHFGLHIRNNWLSEMHTYVEFTELSPARQAWETPAALLDAASHRKMSDVQVSQDARLTALQQAFWAADAASWRALIAGSRAGYEAVLSEGKPARRWEIPAGASQVLQAEARRAVSLRRALRRIWPVP